MKLYSASASPNCIRVLAVANELGIDLEIIEIRLGSGATQQPDFLAMNPNGKVPVLVDRDFVLLESRAIMNYLATDSALLPNDRKTRAIMDQWSCWQMLQLGAAVHKVAFERVVKPTFGVGEPDERVVAAGISEFDRFMPVFDKGLLGKDWVAGPLTVTDFTLASTFIYRQPAGLSVEAYRNVTTWLTRVEALPSWRAAVAPVEAMMAAR